MRILVSGGAGSGKSALAEACAAGLGEERLYVATMRPFGEEGAARVARHRQRREGLRFDTLECYTGLDSLRPEKRYDVILLECLGNLTANEMFDASSAPKERTVRRVLAGVAQLSRLGAHLVVVTNEVFAGAEHYDGGTADYLAALGEIGRRLAGDFEVAVRAVCGLPLVLKGEALWESVW